jgi:hypothetical protein
LTRIQGGFLGLGWSGRATFSGWRGRASVVGNVIGQKWRARP